MPRGFSARRHKIHAVCLLANARVRNRWINDELLHARLLSMTPMNLQNAFAMIHKSRVPDQNKRGRLFEATVKRLVDWWAESTFDEVQQELETKFSASDSFNEDTNETERVRSVNSLMKHALMQRGSRDTGAQLFTALCRALDIPARLVVSLQSVPWRTSVGKQATLKQREGADLIDSDIEGKDAPLAQVKGKEKAHPVIKLRKSKSKPSTVVTHTAGFWTEVFSRQTLDGDGFGRDVTARYARDYTAKVSKAQGIGSGPLGGRKEWWARVVQAITRPYRLRRLEDDELHIHQLTEGMPTTLAGFKDHPMYLRAARHLKRDQVLIPHGTREVQGQKVRSGCQPMKMVKQRAVTISRQREMELAIERAKMYAFSQTELYMPEPIKNGIIPKNEFGNIDLYVPSMLPGGAVHIPCKWLFLFKGVAKIARKLGFDYAEAMVSHMFRLRVQEAPAYPVLEGIVVAAENEGVIVEAYLEAEQDAEERARAKRFDQKQYGSNPTEDGPKEETRREHWQDTEIPESTEDEVCAVAAFPCKKAIISVTQPGGFLTTADDVVQPFHLPSNIHQFWTVRSQNPIISETVPWSPGWEAPDGIEGMAHWIHWCGPEDHAGAGGAHAQLGKGSRNESSEPASQSQVSHLVSAEKSEYKAAVNSPPVPARPTPTPSTKRTRPGHVNNNPTRVLRPRVPKSAAKVQEETR
ncbi:hypothetical protein EDC04DRAFT_2872560 [Pisolithus marmoratus]|nr:hypothetical protein EDC04DRAFT_2872560 [Pisolithus marmoratus]